MDKKNKKKPDKPHHCPTSGQNYKYTFDMNSPPMATLKSHLINITTTGLEKWIDKLGLLTLQELSTGKQASGTL